jgi:tetratricopeptide (TPR) repeat protein
MRRQSPVCTLDRARPNTGRARESAAAANHGQPLLARSPTASAECSLEQAIALHTDGELAEAAALYLRLISWAPDHFDALHLLGVVRHQQQRSAEALDLLNTALERNPYSADALSNRGIVLKALGRYDEALSSCEKALQIKADHVDALGNRAQILLRLRRFAEALKSADAAVLLKPDHIAALTNRGHALTKLGHLSEAAATFERILQLRPNNIDALHDLGNALQLMGRREEALSCYARVLALKSDRVDTLNSQGIVLFRLERFAEALESFAKALSLGPTFAEARNNLGNTLLRLGRPEEALEAYDMALAAKPQFAAAHNNRGNALVALNRHRQALDDFEVALHINPGHAEVLYNRSLALIALGEFREGWHSFECRWDQEDWASRRRNFAQPLWTGEQPIAGKTILLHAEQGLGDAIQFVRYVPMVAAKGARVVLELDSSLKVLLSLTDKVSALVAFGEPLPVFDIHCPLMSLPRAFGTEVATIPGSVPYLTPPADRIAKWAQRLPQASAPRIGVVWAGSPAHRNNFNRSMALTRFAAILATPNVEFVGLQKDINTDDLEILRHCKRMTVLGGELADFADTAAVISMLDVVISVDTSVAHLAGALGRPTWILLPFSADYRWLRDREDSPWYPTARLFRQPRPGEWDSVLQRVQRELRELAQ